jgi:hypothetical protein
MEFSVVRYISLIILVLFPVFFQISVSYGESIHEETFQRLDKIMQEKKVQLFEYLNQIMKNADAIRTDSTMVNFFNIKNNYYQLQKLHPPPEDLVQAIEELKKKINDHYLRNYMSFYDILFIDKGGDIFYTIRKQADYHKNIFRGELSKTALAQQLKMYPDEMFVDYQYYTASDEPSAFIVEPVLKEGLFAGWFVLQCAINKINKMFIQGMGLGETGETFLVNKQKYMLTDSRFYGESSILKRHLSRENIESKFRERAGHKIVIDYRGFRVITSFEVCQIANSEWLLIAKIDEDEVITEQFKEKKKVLHKSIIKTFSEENPRDCGTIVTGSKLVVVDMDEFRKVYNGEMICTFGVSTCTAVIVSFPERFSYMSHISNLDRMYGGKTTDLIGHVFKQIKTFDIYKHERRKLRVTVIANHFETIMNVIDRLADEGIFLSQIRFIYNGDAQYARVLHDYVKNQTFVEWMMDRGTGELLRQCSLDVKTVGDLVKPLIGYEK